MSSISSSIPSTSGVGRFQASLTDGKIENIKERLEKILQSSSRDHTFTKPLLELAEKATNETDRAIFEEFLLSRILQVCNKITDTNMESYIDVIFTLFYRSPHEEIPKGLISFLNSKSFPNAKRNMLIVLTKWVAKIEEVSDQDRLEERLEKLILAFKDFELSNRVREIVLNLESSVKNLKSEILKSFILDYLMIVLPTVNRSNDKINDIPEEALDKVPLALKLLWNEKSLVNHFDKIGFLPLETIKVGDSNCNRLKELTMSFAIDFFHGKRVDTELKIQHQYKGTPITVSLNVTHCALSIISPENLIGNTAYVRNEEGLDRFISRAIAMNQKTCHDPNDPVMCYFHDGIYESKKLPLVNSLHQTMPLHVWFREEKIGKSAGLIIREYSFLNDQWSDIDLDNQSLILDGNGKVADLRRWMELTIMRYRHFKANRFDHYDRTNEAIREGWPGIRIYTSQPRVSLYSALQEITDQDPFVLADPASQRYLFCCRYGSEQVKLVLPRDNAEKKQILSYLREIYTDPLTLNLDKLNSFMAQKVCFLSHKEPAAVSKEEVIQSFDMFNLNGDFNSLCLQHGMTTQKLSEGFKALVNSIFSGSGLRDLNPEENKDSYLVIKIMFTQTYAAYKASPEGMKEFMFDIGKHYNYCRTGLMKELSQHYYVKFPGKAQDDKDDTHRYAGEIARTAMISLIGNFQSLALSVKALRQSVHTRNYIHNAISKDGLKLPKDPEIMHGETADNDTYAREYYIGDDFVKDPNQVVTGNEIRDSWVTELARDMFIPRLITHALIFWDGMIKSSKGDEYLLLLDEFVMDMEGFNQASANESEIISLRQKSAALRATIRDIKSIQEWRIFSAAEFRLLKLSESRKRLARSDEELLSEDDNAKRQRCSRNDHEGAELELIQSDMERMKAHHTISPLFENRQQLVEVNKRIEFLSKVAIVNVRNRAIDTLIERGFLQEIGDDGVYFALTASGAIEWLKRKGVVMSAPFSSSSSSSSSSSYSLSDDPVSDGKIPLKTVLGMLFN